MTSRNSNAQFSGVAVCEPQSDCSDLRSLEKMKAIYQADQQAKFLNLHAETESLLQQLQSLKQQRAQVID
ncbi:hypothetical protein ACKFKF_23680 [Phormidesmis sp. 146-12]